MPRCPHLHSQKTRFSLPEQSRAAGSTEGATFEDIFRMNSPTVEKLREAVLRALRPQVKKKQTLELTESEARNLVARV